MSNLAKHGVDFVEVDDTFWSDPMALTVEDPDHYEQRFVSIAANGLGAILVVVYSYPDEETIRVISARRAGPLERRQYEAGR
ncbi:BrnT family toxin [Burkholderia multivorans]|uniref:BrnT family toxin n=1 Tax=Burkholderia multivorans TaxID=87883 RepID=UPI001C256D33|nr:BrnT family toxin [Burkholderia multivorans]WVN01624.1 BrnT family toxin [Burkholderia multivorans]